MMIIKSKHVVIKTQVFLLVVLMDKIKGIYTIPPQDAKIQIILIGLHELL
jgi:hypothetical protein